MTADAVVNTLLIAGLVLVVVAAFLALWRMERGPTMFDRAVALDVTTIIVLSGMTLMTAFTGRSDLVPLLAVLAIVGFIGSVALARFAAAENPEEARILSEAEVAALAAEQERLDDTAAPVHDPDVELDDDAEDQPAQGDDSSPAGESASRWGEDVDDENRVR